MLSVVLTAVLAAWTCDQEDARIRAHLEDAYAQLEHAVPAGLTASQQQGRATALERLRTYIKAGRFPRNHSERAATPVFVDEADTHCAMGQLLSELGADDVVQRVHSARNLATVPELVDEPGLAAWLVAHGMSAEEAALVQPTYFECVPSVPCNLTVSTTLYDAIMTSADGVTWYATPTRILRGSFVCVGDRIGIGYTRDELTWPLAAILAMPHALANDGLGWVGLEDAQCAERARLPENDRLLAGRECVLNLARLDLRWFAVRCGTTGPSAPIEQRCNPDGRYRASMLPPRGTMRARLETWLQANYQLSVSDAGIDAVAYDAMEARLWELSDDGGVPLDSGVRPVLEWDGGVVAPDCACIAARDVVPFDAGCGNPPAVDAGVRPQTQDAGTDTTPMPMPTGCGCTSTELIMGSLALLLLKRRR
jgi:hypothetical protein